MRFLPPEAEVILYETAFEDDILDRQKVSKSLSALLDRIEDPMVIALDGRWGTGKSYFLKRWVGAHRKQNEGKALTLYFDAFASDYNSDPLIALVAALSERIPAKDRPQLLRLKSLAYKFIKPLAKIGLNVATLGAKDAVNDLGDAVADVINGEAQATVDEFWQREESRQKAMQAFRDSLEELVAGDEGADPTPLVIVVDELDRCRPDYALEVLEIIKHFFAVPMVHFVLGVNLRAMENSVKARYGQEIDGTAYLQKFISLTVTLPDQVGHPVDRKPAALVYARHAAKAMGLPSAYAEEIVECQLPIVARRNSVSIRDVGKILGAVAVLPPEALNKNFMTGWRILVASLIIARVVRKDIYDRLVAGELSDTDLVDYLDATPSRISQTLADGGYNPHHDHFTMSRYDILSAIISGGAGDRESIRNMFSTFGDLRGMDKFPRTAVDRYLSTFEFPLDDQAKP